MGLMRALILAAVLASSQSLSAGGFSDAVMAPGIFRSIAQSGSAAPILQYAHERRIAVTGTDAPTRQIIALPPVAAGRVTLTRTAEGLALALSADANPPRVVSEFDAEGANPVLLFFLENIVRSASAATGGSPYYIRNRIRDSLIEAVAEPAADGTVDVTLHPFAKDEHRRELGVFADLRIILKYRTPDPGRLLLLDATTGEVDGQGYHETLTLEES